MLNKKITELEFVIFDLETTGLKPETEQIIEIAASKVKNGKIIEIFHRFINLYRKDRLEPFIVELTSITEGLLEQKGERVDNVMDDFLEFIDGAVLVAQNAKFDIGFLVNYYLNQNHQIFSPFYLDTINLAKNLRPNETSYKLSLLTEMFVIEYDANAHHRADYDVEITTKVFLKQLSELNANGLKELLQYSFYRPMSEKQENFLSSLIEKNQYHVPENTSFNIQTASLHIDYFLKQ